MEDLILKLVVQKPYAYPWDRILCQNNIVLSKEEVSNYVSELGLDSFELRKEFSWNFYLAIYKCAKEYGTINEVIDNIKLKLKKFKISYQFINEKLIMDLLESRKLNNNESIILFKKSLNNTLSCEEKRTFRDKIALWITEIAADKVMLDGFNSIDLIKKYTMKILSDNYDYLNINSQELSKRLHDLGIGKANNIMLFIKTMKDNKESYDSFLCEDITKSEMNCNLNKEEKKEDDLTNKILGIFDDIEDKNEAEEEKCENVKKVKSLALNVKRGAADEIPKDINSKEVYRYLSGLANLLGYKLLDKNEVAISHEDCSNILYQNEEEKIIKQLLSLENGSVLSQLYNTYKNLNNISIDNIEAVMSNFFSCLFTMGFEINEDDEKVGQKVKVNTKKLLKEFLFSKPVDKDGDIIGQIEYLSWSYKNKVIMPKVIRPID